MPGGSVEERKRAIDRYYIPRDVHWSERGHRAVADALQRGALIAAPFLETSGERGHPVGFSAAHREALAALEGDAGARSILISQAQQIVKVPVNDAGILADIDRPGDLPKGDAKP
jgi:molybdenum cofactor cytidylyltransferase